MFFRSSSQMNPHLIKGRRGLIIGVAKDVARNMTGNISYVDASYHVMS